MKNIAVVFVVLLMAGSAWAQGIVPEGVTGLWRFQEPLADNTATMAATLGVDMVNSAPPGNGYWYTGPWTHLGTSAEPDLLSDGGVSQERSWDYLTVNPSFTANGGGTFVNEYTIAIDYVQTSGTAAYNSLFQTSETGNGSDGDLFISPDGTIGVGEISYSTATFDSTKWHRIVWSVKNTDDIFGANGFFRVYVDGVQFLEGMGQPIDGRFSLYPDKFHLFADDSWEDGWGLVGTVATWNRALTTEEIAQMGGWLDGNAEPTPLIFQLPTQIPGDANGDLMVNETDALALANHWGQSGAWVDGDFNGDGVVDIADASILAANWGDYTSESASAVPEPTFVALFIMGAVSLLAGTRPKRR